MDEQQPISWQFIVLVILIALMVLLVAAAPIPIERAPRPVSFNDLELSQHYDSPDGLSLDYPADWRIIPVESGYFMLSNYAATPGEPPASPNAVVIHFLRAPLEDFGLPGETTAQDILFQMVSRSGRREEAITEQPLGDLTGVRAHFLEQGLEKERVLLTPDERTLVLIEADVPQGRWEQVRGLFDRILETVTISEAAG